MRARFITLLLLLITSLSLMSLGQVFYEEKGKDYNIYNLTENKLNWNPNRINETLYMASNYSYVDYNSIKINRISNIILKSVDCFGYIFFESAKFCIEYGFNHPDTNYRSATKTIITLTLIGVYCYIGLIIFLFGYILIIIIKRIIKTIKKRKTRRRR